jgi:hypothetical protein
MNKLAALEEVEKVEQASENRLRVERKELSAVQVGVCALTRVDRDTLEQFLEGEPEIDFLIHVPKNAFVDELGLALAISRGVVVGSLGDCMRAMRRPDVSAYLPKDLEFVISGLRQHIGVMRVSRIADRSIAVVRHAPLRAVTMAVVNDYDLTAERVRLTVERYAPFDLLLVSNPNGRWSGSADIAAGSARIVMWRDLLSALHRP